jgi:SAM-dependent methyltransferase
MGLARLNDVVVAAGAKFRRRQRVRRLPDPAKVNIGSGLEVAPGWLNVDVSIASMVASWSKPLHRLVYWAMPRSSAIKRMFTEQRFHEVLEKNRFVHHDVRFGLPFPDRSIDFLFSSHFVEHLFRSEALALLREARRVLKPGGVFRICVPDLDHALALLQAGHEERALEFFFFDRDVSEFTRHRYMWGFDSLSTALRDVGFSTIERCRYREGRTPDLDLLDNRPDETLYVEAS